MNKAKLESLLETNDILRADGIRAPERFVKVFAVPTAKLSGAVIDVIEWTTALEDALELAKLADVATRIQWDFNVGTQTEPDLIRLMLYVAGNNLMSALAQLVNEARANRPQPTRY